MLQRLLVNILCTFFGTYSYKVMNKAQYYFKRIDVVFYLQTFYLVRLRYIIFVHFNMKTKSFFLTLQQKNSIVYVNWKYHNYVLLLIGYAKAIFQFANPTILSWKVPKLHMDVLGRSGGFQILVIQNSILNQYHNGIVYFELS